MAMYVMPDVWSVQAVNRKGSSLQGKCLALVVVWLPQQHSPWLMHWTMVPVPEKRVSIILAVLCPAFLSAAALRHAQFLHNALHIETQLSYSLKLAQRRRLELKCGLFCYCSILRHTHLFCTSGTAVMFCKSVCIMSALGKQDPS